MTDAATGDILLYYTVPAEGYVEALRAVDEALRAAGALRCEEVDLARPSRVMPSAQNGVALDRAESPLKRRRNSLTKLDRDVLEQLWLHEGEPLRKRDVAAALGYTKEQVVYSVRKKLKKNGLVVTGRNVGEDGAEIEASFYVNREAVMLKLEQLYSEAGFDPRAYDTSCAEGVSRLFSDLDALEAASGQD